MNLGLVPDKKEGCSVVIDSSFKGRYIASDSWRKEFREAFKETGDGFDDIVTTMSDEDMDKEFDAGYGGEEGCPFTAWSDNWVYFPVCYDGSEWVGYVRRNPCDEKTGHWGGG